MMVRCSSNGTVYGVEPFGDFRDYERVRLQPLCAGSVWATGGDGGDGDNYAAPHELNV
jgi:hypothetical protein